MGVLRRQVVVACIARVLRSASRHDDFRIIHYSVQDDHLHLLVEARDREALARRMTGLLTWVARRVNGLVGRRGRFWADRYHRRDLRTPREVRNALVYVLANRRKHVAERTGRDPGGIDPLSSAVFLDGGWDPRAGPWLERVRASAVRVDGAPPVVPPRTWLARDGWRRHGLLVPEDMPGAPDAQHRGRPARRPKR